MGVYPVRVSARPDLPSRWALVDRYPPFRLDQGPHEPNDEPDGVATPPPSDRALTPERSAP